MVVTRTVVSAAESDFDPAENMTAVPPEDMITPCDTHVKLAASARDSVIEPCHTSAEPLEIVSWNPVATAAAAVPITAPLFAPPALER